MAGLQNREVTTREWTLIFLNGKMTKFGTMEWKTMVRSSSLEKKHHNIE